MANTFYSHLGVVATIMDNVGLERILIKMLLMGSQKTQFKMDKKCRDRMVLGQVPRHP